MGPNWLTSTDANTTTSGMKLIKPHFKTLEYPLKLFWLSLGLSFMSWLLLSINWSSNLDNLERRILTVKSLFYWIRHKPGCIFARTFTFVSVSCVFFVICELKRSSCQFIHVPLRLHLLTTLTSHPNTEAFIPLQKTSLSSYQLHQSLF